MKNNLFITLFFASSWLPAQLPDISTRWENEFIKQRVESYGFAKLSDKIFDYDFSEIIGNQNRMHGDPWSTFIGVFGPKNRRIDFHFTAKKESGTIYKIEGKSKLGSNIRELSGTIELKYGLSTRWEFVNLMIFHYRMEEPGDKVGDGEFQGIGILAFNIKDGKPAILWAESGDFREYNNMFVGIWNRFNSTVKRECIFSFHPSGTHVQLPFRNNMYKEFDAKSECKCFFELKEAVRVYGWEGYDDSNIKKTVWWKE